MHSLSKAQVGITLTFYFHVERKHNILWRKILSHRQTPNAFVGDWVQFSLQNNLQGTASLEQNPASLEVSEECSLIQSWLLAQSLLTFQPPISPQEGIQQGLSLSKLFAILPSAGHCEREHLSQSNGSQTWKCLRILWRACKNTNHWAPTPEFLIQQLRGEAWIFAALINSQVMLMLPVQGTHLEDHCPRGWYSTSGYFFLISGEFPPVCSE